jgi:hypothetical protein
MKNRNSPGIVGIHSEYQKSGGGVQGEANTSTKVSSELHSGIAINVLQEGI